MKAKKFVLYVVSLTILIPISYFIIIDVLLAKEHDEVSLSYKKFLLDNVSGKRLLVDSGSNSNTGIDPSILEKRLGLPVINIADHAGFPLYYKFLVLINNARRGDTVLLPLEWHHYSDEKFDREFLIWILSGHAPYYYRQLDLYKRIGFVFERISIRTFYKSLEYRIKNYSSLQSNASINNRLRTYIKHIENNDGNSFGSGLGFAASKDDHLSGVTCDDYILRFMNNRPLEIGGHISDLLDMLKLLEAKGVRVVFTWPSVVARNGVSCYSTPDKQEDFLAFEKNIRNLIQGHGFTIIGEPKSSAFSEKYYRDTPYHLNKDGAQIRTARLAELLSVSGVVNRNDGYMPGDALKELKLRLRGLHIQYSE